MTKISHGFLLGIFGMLALTGTADSQDTVLPGAQASWFIDIDAGVAIRTGSSSTTNGGKYFNGTVSAVEFDRALSIGGSLGYELTPALDLLLSYNYVHGSVRWTASFPGLGDTYFAGQARSDLILANLRYNHDVSPSTQVSALVGAGVAVNKLTDVVESDAWGTFAELANGSVTSFAARAGLEMSHQLNDAFAVKLGASLDYYGGFETGASRSFFNGVDSPIGSYKIDSAWGATVTAGVSLEF